MKQDVLSTRITAHIGSPYEGGFYGGMVRLGDSLFAVIWAPKAEGETTGVWLDGEGEDLPGTRSCCDSLSNTLALAEAGGSLAKWALGLRINGFDDWCLPARDVLELGYRHLKPGTAETWCSFRDGDNPSSAPVGYPYLEAEPIVQTSVPAFQAGGEQAFDERWYWSSSQYSAGGAWGQYFLNGSQSYYDESAVGRARAVRLIQLTT